MIFAATQKSFGGWLNRFAPVLGEMAAAMQVENQDPFKIS